MRRYVHVRRHFAQICTREASFCADMYMAYAQFLGVILKSYKDYKGRKNDRPLEPSFSRLRKGKDVWKRIDRWISGQS